MNDFELIGWPEIQDYMYIDGFEDNSTLVLQNDKLGIDSMTYLVSVEWLKAI